MSYRYRRWKYPGTQDTKVHARHADPAELGLALTRLLQRLLEVT